MRYIAHVIAWRSGNSGIAIEVPPTHDSTESARLLSVERILADHVYQPASSAKPEDLPGRFSMAAFG
jgi:hypothetical protein